MKKIVLIATALLLCVSSKAQNAVGSWSLQPKAGINLATMTNDDDAKIRVGLVAGNWNIRHHRCSQFQRVPSILSREPKLKLKVSTEPSRWTM